MARISKQKLDPKTEKQLFTQFITLYTKADKMEQSALFEALLSETERIMLIKRLAVVFLLTEQYSTYAVSKTLLVSDSTVRLIQSYMLMGRYDPIIRLMQKKAFDKAEFWKTVEVLLRCGLPPRGRGRWKWLYEMEDVPTIVRLRKKKS